MLTSIVEEGRIARVTFTAFDHLTLPHEERNHLIEFLGEVRDYEHLIIDIRHVGGGWFFDQVELLIRPNITEMIEYYSFGFFTDGQLASYAAEFQRQYILQIGNIGAHFAVGGPTGYAIYPARELVERYNLIYMNEGDLERLAYGYKLSTLVVPWLDSDLAFNGHIWVLVSAFNFSAAEIFARLSKEAGFTLVGHTTGGAIGGAGLTQFRMPNSGIIIRFDTLYITDSLGRAKEEFPTEPHHFAMPGRCALQTTLALIEEL